MEAVIPKHLFVRRLAAGHRVLLLGGMAVIAHGRARHTKDFDLWLEPFSTAEEWSEKLITILRDFPESYVWSLAQRRRLDHDEIAAEIEDFGVIRIGGLDLPVDVFRRPNEFQEADFEKVWSEASRMEDGLGLTSELHLYVSKINTGRSCDEDDIAFLEGLVKNRFTKRLPVCDLAEAQYMLERYTDPALLMHAKANPSLEVRELALKYLREFAAEGDPYSRDILAEWKEE